jgi:hypothetical protein
VSGGAAIDASGFLEREFVAEAGGNGIEKHARLGDDFRADAVTGKKCDGGFHCGCCEVG